MTLEIKTPDGSVEVIDPTTILCFREALPEEFANAVAIKFAGGVVYSAETIEEILRKLHVFPDIKIVQLTPPVRPNAVWINARKVVQIAPADGAYGNEAQTVIKFSLKLFQAVRENVENVRYAIDHAQAP